MFLFISNVSHINFFGPENDVFYYNRYVSSLNLHVIYEFFPSLLSLLFSYFISKAPAVPFEHFIFFSALFHLSLSFGFELFLFVSVQKKKKEREREKTKQDTELMSNCNCLSPWLESDSYTKGRLGWSIDFGGRRFSPVAHQRKAVGIGGQPSSASKRASARAQRKWPSACPLQNGGGI